MVSIALYSLICLWMMSYGDIENYSTSLDTWHEVFECIDEMSEWGLLTECDYQQFLNRDHEEDLLLIEILASDSDLYSKIYNDIHHFVVDFSQHTHSEKELIDFVEKIVKVE